MGIVGEAETNVEMTAVAIVDLDLLYEKYENRINGAATTFKDQRRQKCLYKKWASHLNA